MGKFACGLLVLLLTAFLPAHGLTSPAGLPVYQVNEPPGLSRHKPHILAAAVEYDPIKCTVVSTGSFVVLTQPKYGKISFGSTTITQRGLYCNEVTFPATALVYEWTTDNNKSDTDYILSQWKTADYTENITLRPNVEIVRPIGEMTEFIGWESTRGLWMQRLIPPRDMPDFDFTGEVVKEVSAGDTDTCYDGKFPYGPATLTPHEWVVHDKVEWGPDGVGWGNNEDLKGQCAIEYYRCVKRTPCASGLRQQMLISSPADNGAFVKYGTVNFLESFIFGEVGPQKLGYGAVTSKRADGRPPPPLPWLSGPSSCPEKIVHLPC